jgi:glyoxylate/hydroxypyruvate reductase A
VWPERVGKPGEVAYACAWHAPHGLLAHFLHLKIVFSLGAGVDHIVADPHLPDVPVLRMVDADLTIRMTEYVVLHVLMHHRRQRLYEAQQRERVWREHEQSAANEVAVGVMGLGVLGRDAASALRRLGFRVAGWSRTPKSLADVETFHGEGGLDPFLRRTEILVCLLPATAATQGVLCLALLRKLRRDGAARGAYLINAGRGTLQVDADILAALEEGSLAGVTLDVFPAEPLPVASPLWTHPKVTITPHNAAASDPRALVANILAKSNASRPACRSSMRSIVPPATSARFSKFVIRCGTLGHELRKPKGTSNSRILVPLFDLKFLKWTRVTGAGISNRRH